MQTTDGEPRRLAQVLVGYDVIQQLLMPRTFIRYRVPDMPPDATILATEFDNIRRCVSFVIEAPTLELVEPAVMPPVLPLEVEVIQDDNGNETS